MAQYRDDFEQADLIGRTDTASGWTWLTGDGSAKMQRLPGPGHATIAIDATANRRNTWWALVQHEVTGYIDPGRLSRPGAAVRI